MRKRACRLVGRMSMLDCQVWLTSSSTLTEGSGAAGRSLPDMSLAFALLAAINGSRLLRHAVARALTTAPSPRRRQPGGRGHSHPSSVAALGGPSQAQL